MTGAGAPLGRRRSRKPPPPQPAVLGTLREGRYLPSISTSVHIHHHGISTYMSADVVVLDDAFMHDDDDEEL
jgi:hypothetical protein